MPRKDASKKKGKTKFSHSAQEVVTPVGTVWVAECSSCGKVGPYQDPAKGRVIQHNGLNRKYCGYYKVNPRLVKSFDRIEQKRDKSMLFRGFPLPPAKVEFTLTTKPINWVAECSTCGIVGSYKNPLHGRRNQHNDSNRKYCGYFQVNPREEVSAPEQHTPPPGEDFLFLF
jgi:uncharacterized Zn finger protein